MGAFFWWFTSYLELIRLYSRNFGVEKTWNPPALHVLDACSSPGWLMMGSWKVWWFLQLVDFYIKAKVFEMLQMIVAGIHPNKHLAPDTFNHNIQCTSFQSSSTSSPPIIPITMLIRLRNHKPWLHITSNWGILTVHPPRKIMKVKGLGALCHQTGSSEKILDSKVRKGI